MTPLFNPALIVDALERHGVQFVLIGGYAAQLHGASRPTNDLDIAPSRHLDNLGRLAAALRELDAGIRVDNLDAGLPFACTAESLQGMSMLNLRTNAGDLDLTFSPAGFADGYNDLAPHSVEKVLGAATIKVATLDAIIQSKKLAGRPKDFDALPELTRLVRARTRLRRPSRATKEVYDEGLGL